MGFVMLTLEYVKRYLNITTNDYDTFLTGLIDAIVSEFSFLNRRQRRVISKINYLSELVGYSILRNNVKIHSITSVKVTKDLINFKEFNDYNLRKNVIYLNNCFDYDFVEVVLERGYTQTEPNREILLKLAEIVALEFKKSFQADGAIFYSGRQVGDFSFNYYTNPDETIKKLKREIRLMTYSPDEIHEEDI